MIIIGRGGQVILANKPDVLHVRVIAPLEKRIAVRAAREGLSLKEAQKKLVEADKAHVDFVKNFFDVDNRDPLLYDLVINTDKISIDAAAELIYVALNRLPKQG
jgi:cytidylate kinase